MSYQTIQTALFALVLSYDNSATFTRETASEDDFRVLDNSAGDVAAVVTQAGDTTEDYLLDGRGKQGARFAAHEIGILIASAIRTDNDADAIQTLYSSVEGVAAHIRRYPLLNAASGVKHAVPIRRTRKRLIAPVGDETRSTHWSQMIVVQVVEEITLSLLESGG